MKKSAPYWIRIAAGAHRIVPSDRHETIRLNNAKISARRSAGYVEGFTNKEWEIINGERAHNIRTTEVTKLINKAEDYGRFDIADKLRDMYEYLYEDPYHINRLPKEEALSILDDLTPDNMKEKK